MKYNININQVKCQEFWLNFSQWAVMDLLLSISTRATGKEINWEIYYRLTTGKLIEELPVISDKKNTFTVIIGVLIERWLLGRFMQGNLTYYKLTESWKSFHKGHEKNHTTSWKKSWLGDEKNHDNNNTIYNNTYNINNNMSEISETNTKIQKQKPDKVADVDKKPAFKNKWERFEEFWKLFPHARPWKKKDSIDFYRRNEYTEDEIIYEANLLLLRVKYWLQDPKYIPWCHYRTRDFIKTNEVMLQKIIKQIVYAHMKKPVKIREDAELLDKVFTKEVVSVYVKEYNKEFNWVKIDLK